MTLNRVHRAISENQEFIRGSGSRRGRGGARRGINKGCRLPQCFSPRKTQIHIGRGTRADRFQFGGRADETEIIILLRNGILEKFPDKGVAEKQHH